MTDDVLYSSNHWAKKSHKWAEGEDSDVTPMGGTHSSKGWATICQQYTITCSDLATSAGLYKRDAENAAASAADSAVAALKNSQKLLMSFNRANAWYRTYQWYEQEKHYRFITLNVNDASATIGDTEYTTDGDIDNGMFAFNNQASFFIDGELYSCGVKNLSKVDTLYSNTDGSVVHGDDDKLHTIGAGTSYWGSGPYLTYNDWDCIHLGTGYNVSHMLPGNSITFGIRDGKLYYIPFEYYVTSLSETLLDDTGTWEYVTGYNMSSGNHQYDYIAVGVKDGKLYRISSLAITLVDDTHTWSKDNLRYSCYTTQQRKFLINNGKMFFVTEQNFEELNSNIVFVKHFDNYAISSDGKLYILSTPGGVFTATQLGSDTDWQEILSTSPIILCLKGGNLVKWASDQAVQLTTGQSFVGAVGGASSSSDNWINTIVAWTQTPVTKYEYVYTTPTSGVGDNLYGSTSLSNPRAIVSIDSSNVTDATYTYTRDSSKDTYFTDKPDTYVSRALTTDDIIDALT